METRGMSIFPRQPYTAACVQLGTQTVKVQIILKLCTYKKLKKFINSELPKYPKPTSSNLRLCFIKTTHCKTSLE